MKWKAILLSFLTVTALVCMAGDRNVHKLTIANVATNATASTTNSTEMIDGYIDSVYLEITSGATATVSIVSITNNATYVPAKTIVSKSAFDTDGWYEPRAGEETTGLAAITDSSTRLLIARQRLQLQVHSANATNKTVTAYVVTDSD